MRCDQFEDRLNDVLDRRDDPRRDASLTAHAAECRQCRNLASAYAMLTDGAAELSRASLPSKLEPLHDRRLVWSVAVAPLLATAAAALFMFNQARRSDEVPTLPSAAVPPVAAAVTLPTPARLPVSGTVSDESAAPVFVDLARTTGRAYVGLIHDTARKLDDAVALASALPPAQQLLEPVLFPEDGLLRRTTERFAPVAGETIDALRQVFQSQDSQQL